MRQMRMTSPVISLLLIMAMLFITGPANLAHAKMIGTQSMVQSAQAENARADITAFLSREDVKTQLVDMGIAPDEAMSRAQNMSDAEAVAFADDLKNAPAGGSGLGVVVGAAVLVFLVLLATDILGFTKVFPFTKSVK